MCQTLVTIPSQIAGIDVFGFGWLLGLWLVFSAILIGWSYANSGWGPITKGYLSSVALVAAAIAFVLPLFTKADGLPIRGYGVMLALAVLAGVGISAFRARQAGIDPELMYSLAIWLCSAGIVGARLFYVLEYPDKFWQPTWGETIGAVLNFTEGGLVVYGSLLAGAAAMLVFLFRNKLPGLALADLIAPGVVLGAGLGRLGCFLNGCCYGGLSDVAWAMPFPVGSPVYMEQVQRGQLFLQGLKFQGTETDPPLIAEVQAGSEAERQGLKPGDRLTAVGGIPVGNVAEAEWELMKLSRPGSTVSLALSDSSPPRQWTLAERPWSLPVHPTQLYSLIDALLLCALILAYEPYRRGDGEISAIVLTLHPISRFLLEVIRVDEGSVFGTGMSISQNISICIFLGGLVLWVYLFVRHRPPKSWPAQAALAN